MPAERDDATTSELRHDWLADRWVIIAPQRTERPFEFVRFDDSQTQSLSCPFCRGHEEQTPVPVASYKPAKCNAEGDNETSEPVSNDCWSVRVVPNKFPAVNLANADANSQTQWVTDPQALVESSDRDLSNSINLFQRRSLSGGHEVIVESPEHLVSVSQLRPQDMSLVFRAYRDRLHHWLTERGISYAVLFKNVGQDAGASLVHTHSQLIATDILPPDVQRAAERMQLFHEQEGECLFCRMADDEVEHGARLIERTADFVAICPFASRLPSLVTILPINHQSRFESLDDEQLEQVAWLTHRTIRRIEKQYPSAAYNFVVHTAPGNTEWDASFHWRLELFPRLTKVAGFEWGSDCYINPLAPEDAAASLRQVGV